MIMQQAKYKYSVVLLTCNAEAYIAELLRSIHSQSVPPQEIIVIDSSSTDATAAIVEKDGACRLTVIDRKHFRHGGTRHMAIGQCSGDFAVFLTQDALPCDDCAIERLLRAFDNEKAAMAYGRQIARPDADAIERLFRAYNYPDKSRTNTKRDIQKLGVRAYFFSDTFSAYRMCAYRALGGFDCSATTNEDMLMAYTALNAGWETVYCAEACVWHSHNSTLKQQYNRSRETARFMALHPELIRDGEVTGEGFQMLRFTARELIRNKSFIQLPSLVLRCAARYLGHRRGLGMNGRGIR